MKLKGFLDILVGLLGALLGGGAISLLAPPTSEPTVARVILLALSAAVWAICWVVTRHPAPDDRRWRRWTFRLTAAVVAVLVASGVGYVLAREAWTVSYADQHVVIGSELTASGKAYFEQRPNASPAQAVWDNQGRAEDIWSRGIVLHKVVLWALHVPFLSAAVFLILWCWHLVRRS